MRRHALAIGLGLAAIALSWASASGADDLANERELRRDRPGLSQGIRPQDAKVGKAAPQAGTTTTTAATLGMASPGEQREQAEERELVRPHRSMLITGSAIFVGSYAASAVVGGISNTDADKRLFIPLVGPWLDLADRQCGLGQCGVREDVNILHIIGSGAAQATGLGIAIASLFVEERRNGRPAPMKPAPEPPRTTWRVIPIAGGIGAVGTF